MASAHRTNDNLYSAKLCKSVIVTKFIRSALGFIGLSLSVTSFCQRQITEADAVSMAVKNSKNISVSDLGINSKTVA